MTTSTAQIQQRCIEAINTFLFDKVWNEPVSEYRSNIRPSLIKPRSCSGSFAVFDANIKLPTTNEPYFVWSIGTEDSNLGLNLESQVWYDTATICNDYRTLIHMYGINGHMFAKSAVFLRFNKSRTAIFIAVKKENVLDCITLNELHDVFLTFYFDSDCPNPIYISSFKVTTLSLRNTYNTYVNNVLKYMTDKSQLQVYCDGIEITDPDNSPSFTVGSYYDFIVDTNVIFAFDVNVTSDNDNPVYLSTRDKLWKQLVHIPKALNTDNNVITHNTCDFFIRKALSDDTYGLYLHRAADQAVTQVTHNDFGIPLYILDAYRDYLQDQHITIHGVARLHDKNNVLLRDASYIDLLYSDKHSDADIVKILCGKGPSQIPWWTAANLEQSSYLQMLFDTPNQATAENMQEFVDALGYYQIVNLLCQRIVDTTITDAFSGELTFQLPTLYLGKQCYPIVYLNGKALQRQYVMYTNNADSTITIGIDEKIVTTPGDKLTVMFYITGDNTIYEFSPTEANLTITVPYTSVSVYRKEYLETSLQGVSETSNYSYVECGAGSNIYVAVIDEKAGTTKLTFNYRLAGKTFIIQNNYCTYHSAINLDSYTADGKTLCVPITASIYGDVDTTYPLLSFRNISVYLNGNYLVKDMDYFINDVTDADGNIGIRELVVQTMDYFTEGSSTILEVIVNMAEIEDISNGIEVNDKLYDTTPVNLYFSNISAAHVNGKLVRDGTFKGVYLELPKGKYPVGSKWEIQTSVPSVISDFINQYSTNDEANRIKIMSEYFYDLNEELPDTVVMESAHRLYSVLLNNFIYDVLHKKISVGADPDENRINDIMKPYLYLKNMDLVYKERFPDFVDFYPQYVTYEIPTEYREIIERFVKLYMPANQSSTRKVVYTNS